MRAHPSSTIRPAQSVRAKRRARTPYSAAACVAPDAIGRAAPRCGLHLGALSALAVAQPLFDLISKNPDFLVARALIGWQVVALGLALVLVPPLLALGVEALSGLVSRPLRAVVHLFFVALFVALIAIQALKDIAPRRSAPS